MYRNPPEVVDWAIINVASPGAMNGIIRHRSKIRCYEYEASVVIDSASVTRSLSSPSILLHSGPYLKYSKLELGSRTSGR
jgi:hypothetical protein